MATTTASTASAATATITTATTASATTITATAAAATAIITIALTTSLRPRGECCLLSALRLRLRGLCHHSAPVAASVVGRSRALLLLLLRRGLHLFRQVELLALLALGSPLPIASLLAVLASSGWLSFDHLFFRCELVVRVVLDVFWFLLL